MSMKNNSILEKLGIEENQSIEVILEQLNLKLSGKVDDEKMEEIVNAVKQYFKSKSAVNESPVVNAVEPLVATEENKVDVNLDSQVENIESSIQSNETIPTPSVQPETVVASNPPQSFDFFKFYQENDQKGVWEKVLVALVGLMGILSLTLISKFGFADEIALLDITSILGGQKFIVVLYYIVVAMVLGIVFVEYKFSKKNLSKLSIITPAITAISGLVAVVMSTVPVFNAGKYLKGTLDIIQDVYDYFNPMRYMWVKTAHLAVVFFSVTAVVFLVYSISKKREFSIGIRK